MVVLAKRRVVNKGIHITKRDLFYTDVKLFKTQTDSDAVIDDVACLVRTKKNPAYRSQS